MRKFIVSSYPFIHSGNDINKMFLYVSISLVLPVVFGFLFFGLNALVLVVVSLVSCYVFELIYNLINKGSYFVNNFSFFVTSMILALTLPVNTPIHIIILSAFVAIFVTKMVFGGLGKNKFNPALVGRCFAGLLSSDMALKLYEVSINGEIATSLSAGGTNTIYNLIMGQAVGGVGTTSILILLLCFGFLAYTKTLDPKITVFSVLSYLVVGLCLNGLELTFMNMLSGSFIFASIFIVTDPNTSPNSLFGKIIYSVVFGGLSALIWNYGVLGENTIFVVALLANFLTPFLDKYVRLKPISLGGFRNAYKI